jgi:glycosyltransferase involved in cell wall biosynthesis
MTKMAKTEGNRVIILRSNTVSPDPRVEKIARCLSTNGYTVCVLARNTGGNFPAAEKKPSFSILRLDVPSYPARGLGNLPSMLRWQFALWRWLVSHQAEYDLIHACDFDTLLPALWCRTFFTKKVIYDIFDYYADMLRNTPKWLVRIVRWIERFAIGAADAVILADEARREQIRGSNPRKLAFIYNSPEDVLDGAHEIEKEPDVELRIAYIGNIQSERGIFELLEVISRHPSWRLDIGGFGPDVEKVIEHSRKSPNVVWHGLVPYEMAIEINRRADVLLATYDPRIPNNRFSSPNKVFEAMMLAKPIIVAENTHADFLVNEEGCGLVVPYGDRDALEAALESLKSNPGLSYSLGQRGRTAYINKYDWKLMQRKLIELYSNVRCLDRQA